MAVGSSRRKEHAFDQILRHTSPIISPDQIFPPKILYGFEVFSATSESVMRVTEAGTTMEVTLFDGAGGVKATLIAGGKDHFEISGALHLPFGVARKNFAQHIVNLEDGGYVVAI